MQISKLYHLSRHFKLDEINASIITSLELHPRGNKIFLRLQNFTSNDKHDFRFWCSNGLDHAKASIVREESQGKLKATTCGTLLFASSGSCIQFYLLQNGNLTSFSKNAFKTRIPSDVKVSSIDYHQKCFFFVRFTVATVASSFAVSKPTRKRKICSRS